MSPTVWHRDVESFCPGVGKGRMYPAEEIRGILDLRRGS